MQLHQLLEHYSPVSIMVMPLEPLIAQNLDPNDGLTYGLLPHSICVLQN